MGPGHKNQNGYKKWEYQYSQTRNLLYKKHANLHLIHDFKRNSRQWTRSQQRVKLFEPKFKKTIEKLPCDIIPVDETYNNKAISIYSITTITNEKIHHPPKTWKEHMNTLPLWDQQLFLEVKVCSTKKLK